MYTNDQTIIIELRRRYYKRKKNYQRKGKKKNAKPKRTKTKTMRVFHASTYVFIPPTRDRVLLQHTDIKFIIILS